MSPGQAVRLTLIHLVLQLLCVVLFAGRELHGEPLPGDTVCFAIVWNGCVCLCVRLSLGRGGWAQEKNLYWDQSQLCYAAVSFGLSQIHTTY